MSASTAVVKAAFAVLELDGEGRDAVDGARGVYIHVEISPRACLEACGGGGLPATGGGVPEMLVVAGVVVLVIGIALVATHLIRRHRSSD